MSIGTVVAICTSPAAGAPMQEVPEALAIAGYGLKGDRYARGEGSFNKRNIGRRQVTLMNSRFFAGSGFEYVDNRRNIMTRDIELMWLIGKEFQIGQARMRGIKYCDPCKRPSKLSCKPDFDSIFQDLGGLVAEIVEGGRIRRLDAIVPPPKGY